MLQLRLPSSVVAGHRPEAAQARSPVRSEIQLYHLWSLSHLVVRLVLNPRAMRGWPDHAVSFTSAPSFPALLHALRPGSPYPIPSEHSCLQTPFQWVFHLAPCLTILSAWMINPDGAMLEERLTTSSSRPGLRLLPATLLAV